MDCKVTHIALKRSRAEVNTLKSKINSVLWCEFSFLKVFVCYTIISFNSIFNERNIGGADFHMLQMVFSPWPLWTSNTENLLKTVPD